MEAGPMRDVAGMMSVPEAATARAAIAAFSVIEAVVFGLTIRMRMRSAYLCLPSTQHHHDTQRDENDGEGKQRRHRAERIKHRRRDVGSHPVDFEGQRIVAARGH